MTGIIEFLTARLDEDERVAKLAAEAGCKADPRHRWMVERWTSEDPAAIPTAIWVSDENEIGVATVNGNYAADHIARHDPARVLAEVAAKRAILGGILDTIHDNEHLLHYDRDIEPDMSEPLIRALAAPYADHPDYQDAWKP